MLNGSFSEAGKAVVDLPEDTVAVFKVFECWLYSGDVVFPTVSVLRTPVVLDAPLLHIVKVFVFADKIGADKMKRETLEALRDMQIKHSKLCSPQTTRYAFENTPAGSPLRRLLVDMFVYGAVPEDWEGCMLDFPPEFLADVTFLHMKRLYTTEDSLFDDDVTHYSESSVSP